MSRTMLNENTLPKYFWAEAVNIACYVLDRMLIRSYLNKIPYELWKDRNPNIDYFKVFRWKYFILKTKDNLHKFDPKFDVDIFLGYSNISKAYRMHNKRTLVVEESIHITFDESIPLWRKLLLMMMQMKSNKKNYQKINKRMNHIKIKRTDKKDKQMWSNNKVLLKHSLRSGGMFSLNLRI